MTAIRQRKLHLKINCCWPRMDFADYVKEMFLSACRTCSTIIFSSFNQLYYCLVELSLPWSLLKRSLVWFNKPLTLMETTLLQITWTFQLSFQCLLQKNFEQSQGQVIQTLIPVHGGLHLSLGAIWLPQSGWINGGTQPQSPVVCGNKAGEIENTIILSLYLRSTTNQRCRCMTRYSYTQSNRKASSRSKATCS